MAPTEEARLTQIARLVEQWRGGALPASEALSLIHEEAQEAPDPPAGWAGTGDIYDKGLG